jgi:F-type H+-transporting ATPase subunit a
LAAEHGMDPIHQFVVAPVGQDFHVFGVNASFTNASLWMAVVVGLISLLMIAGTQQRAIVPGRWQSLAEMAYEFVASTVRLTAGTEGMRFFPFVFALFMFVLCANLIGLVPYAFTVTSQIIVTFAFALLVIGVVII